MYALSVGARPECEGWCRLRVQVAGAIRAANQGPCTWPPLQGTSTLESLYAPAVRAPALAVYNSAPGRSMLSNGQQQGRIVGDEPAVRAFRPVKRFGSPANVWPLPDADQPGHAIRPPQRDHAALGTPCLQRESAMIRRGVTCTSQRYGGGHEPRALYSSRYLVLHDQYSLWCGRVRVPIRWYTRQGMGA